MNMDEESPILTAPDYIKWSLLRPSSLLDEKSAIFKDLDNKDFRESLLTSTAVADNNCCANSSE